MLSLSRSKLNFYALYMKKTNADIIEARINRMRDGYIFTSSDFSDIVRDPVILSRSLRSLVQSGKIKKVGKGRFYKPKQTVFGELPPYEEWYVQEFLMDGKKIIGYLTGQYAYNLLGLSTQISSAYTVGSNTYRRMIVRDGVKIRFIVQPNTITRANIPLLQILDSIRFIRQIPACTPDEACEILRGVILRLRADEQQLLASLAMKYTDYVRAITGAMLDETDTNTQTLFGSLNPASVYKIGLSEAILPNCKKWRIR